MKLRGWTIPGAGLFALLVVGTLGACGTDDASDGNGGFGGYGGYESCSDFTSCGTCTPVSGCGWCTDSNGNGLCASDPDSCPALMFDWTWNPDGCRVAADGGGVQVVSEEAGTTGPTGLADATAPADALPPAADAAGTLADALAPTTDAATGGDGAPSAGASASSDAGGE